MASLVKCLTLASLVGIVAACGQQNDYFAEELAKAEKDRLNESKNADEREFEFDNRTDANDFRLSLPVEPVKSGVVIVEKSIVLPRAAVWTGLPSETKKAGKCVVFAGAYLSSIQSDKEGFSGTLSYPKTLAAKAHKKACREGDLVSVQPGSGFKGLAITVNTSGTSFALDDGLDPGSTDGSEAAKPIAATSKEAFLSPAVEPPCFLPADDGSVHTKGCVPLPYPPKPKTACSVFGNRGNISIHAAKSRSTITGIVVEASDILDLMWRSDECESGAKIVVDSLSLRKALLEIADEPKPIPMFQKK